MKGTAPVPECKYSQAIANIIGFYNLRKFYTVNVKPDQLLKRALKEFSKWPTIPQVFVKGKFVGGHDTIKAMHHDGSLEELFKTHSLVCYLLNYRLNFTKNPVSYTHLTLPTTPYV
eukprot:TRINITY_DN9691_c0_g4_i1.p1 TRINITY_DN9691_c0_g4~~TRINITY_DN9691_c0_g4_i1.p1  ORF type:complete len:116 (-),score=18.82 TRINITY_DN9691_c0_g4_i1:18-365(-)